MNLTREGLCSEKEPSPPKNEVEDSSQLGSKVGRGHWTKGLVQSFANISVFIILEKKFWRQVYLLAPSCAGAYSR